MALSDDMLGPERGRPKCSIALLFDELDDESCAVLRRWLADPDIDGARIAAGIRKGGHHMGGQTISRHRAKRCTCAQ